MTDLKITTSNRLYAILYWHELTTREQREFDWLDTDDRRVEASFVRYHKVVYALSEFMRCDISPTLGSWHGYYGDSLYSGVLCRYQGDDTEHVQMATYTC